VTPQVFQFIGPSNDGRRHGRGTYLFCLKDIKSEIYFLYFKVYGCVRFWKFLLKMLKCYIIRVFAISCRKKIINTNKNLSKVVGEQRQSL
jgi:hypothetical protein